MNGGLLNDSVSFDKRSQIGGKSGVIWASHRGVCGAGPHNWNITGRLNKLINQIVYRTSIGAQLVSVPLLLIGMSLIVVKLIDIVKVICMINCMSISGVGGVRRAGGKGRTVHLGRHFGWKGRWRGRARVTSCISLFQFLSIYFLPEILH